MELKMKRQREVSLITISPETDEADDIRSFTITLAPLIWAESQKEHDLGRLWFADRDGQSALLKCLRILRMEGNVLTFGDVNTEVRNLAFFLSSKPGWGVYLSGQNPYFDVNYN